MYKSLITTAEITDTSQMSEWKFSFKLFTFPLVEKEISFDSDVEERIFSLGRESINAFFTSEVAVRSVFERLEQTPDWNIYCLSGKTRRTLLKYVPERLITAMGRNSTELSTFIKQQPGSLKTLPTVFFCGNRRMPTLPAAFNELAIPLEEVISYKTACHSSSISGDINALFFFSPSAVECFFAHNAAISEATVLFAIGETTASAIKAYCNNKIIVAPEPSQEALLNEVKAYFEGIQNHEL